MNEIQQQIDRLYRRILMTVAPARITTTDDTGLVTTAQMGISRTPEVINQVPVMENYGFHTNPPPNTDAIAIFAQGNRANPVIVGTNLQDPNKPKNLQPGEMSLWTNEGDAMKFARQQAVTLTAGNSFTANTKTATVNGSSQVTLNTPLVHATVDIHADGKVDAKGGFFQNGQPIGGSGSAGPPGPAGPAGPAGPQGEPGSQGVPGQGYYATSATSVVIGTGAKTFTTQPGLAYSVGARARAASQSIPGDFMEGLVSAYSGTTLTIQADLSNGSGSLNDWDINLAGEQGEPGPTGSQGPVGPPSTVPGPPGATGPAGAAATATAGTTTTGAPGTNASVVNVGSLSAAVFDFTIPAGTTGSTGPAGPAGPQGVPGPAGAAWQVGSGLYLDTATTPNTIEVATPYLALSGGTVSGALAVTGATTLATATATTVATTDNSTNVATTAYVKAQNYVTGGPYLALSGGTLTGALAGTNASFSGNIVGNTVQATSYFQTAGYYLYLANSTGAINGAGGTFFYGDGNYVAAHIGGSGAFLVQNSSGANVLQVGSGGAATFAGALTITGGITYASGGGSIAYEITSGSYMLYSMNGAAWQWMCLGNLGGGYQAVTNIAMASNFAYGVIGQLGSLYSFTIAASDRRLKSNIEPAKGDALAIVCGVPVYDVDYTPPRPRRDVGDVAIGPLDDIPPEHWDFSLLTDEVKPLLPYAVIPAPQAEGFTGYESFHAQHLISVLWRALQQVNDRLAAVEAAR